MNIVIGAEIILICVLFIKDKHFCDGIKCNELRSKGLWWVFVPEIGVCIFQRVKGFLKNSSKDRSAIARFVELYGTSGQKIYEISRCGQIAMVLIAAIVVQWLFFNFNDKPEAFIFYGGLILGIVFLPDKTVEDLCEARRRKIESAFPDFLSRLAVLVDAGVNVRNSIKRTIKGSSDEDLYKELRVLVNDLELGKGENYAFESFSKRCYTPTAAMFSSVVLQNIKKGNKELSSILRIFAATSWKDRKNSVIKRGEEAAAKLMVPMMIVFIAIMILMAAPAVMQMGL